MNKRLYMASYKDFNDPAEGFYLMDKPTREVLSCVREGKNKEIICCLSKNKNHSLLWSHYADGHKGVCIEVDVTSKINPVNVSYVCEMPVVERVDDNVAQKVLSYKSNIWAYEEEVRYFKELVDGKQIRKFLHVKVLRVYLGLKMNDKQVRFIKKLIYNIDSSIEVIKMKEEDVYWGYENSLGVRK